MALSPRLVHQRIYTAIETCNYRQVAKKEQEWRHTDGNEPGFGFHLRGTSMV